VCARDVGTTSLEHHPSCKALHHCGITEPDLFALHHVCIRNSCCSMAMPCGSQALST